MALFCGACGRALEGATRCAACGTSALPVPTVLVACFVFQRDRLLWMRRAEQPQRGFWAIPAGYLELDESLPEAAARELREETGYVAGSLELLASLDVDPSKAANRGHVFLGLEAERLHDPEPDEMEAPDTLLVPAAELPGLIASGEICAAASVAGLLLLLGRD